MAPSARRVLSYDPAIVQHRGSLFVHAVFPHTWQLRSGSGRILSVVASRWNGPLTLRVIALPDDCRVAPGTSARLTGAVLQIGGTVLSFDGAAPWLPRRTGYDPLQLSALPADMQVIQDAIGEGGHPHPQPFSRRAGEGRLPGDTRGGYAAAGSSTGGDARPAWWRHGRGVMAALNEALARQDADASAAHAIGLLGLGPGLTPAGDDMLCGLMAGLAVLGGRSDRHGERCEDVLAALAGPVLRAAPGRTTSLSATLLESSTRGIVTEPLLQVLRTVGSSQSVTGIADVVMLGHSSGRDMLTGALMACVALVRWEEVFGSAMVGAR